jgi:putative transposase
VTLRTHERSPLFGAAGDHGVALNDAGRMVSQAWLDLEIRFDGVAIDVFVVMPDHLHGLIILNTSTISTTSPANGQEQALRPAISNSGTAAGDDIKPRAVVSLGRTMQAFKSITTLKYSDGVRGFGWAPFNGKVWHRNYHDHSVRSQPELDAIRRYIKDNPGKLADIHVGWDGLQ